MMLALVMVLVLALAGCGVKDTDPANAAYITLSVEAELGKAKDGSLIAAKALEIPAEGTTVGEVIKAVHANWFADGEAGFATAKTEWGDSITKLWGIENGGSYGYYVNSAMSMGLTDPVKPGDRVDIMVYKDAKNFSDVYITLDAQAAGDKVTVTVQYMGFDANWNAKLQPLKGCKICYIGSKGNIVDTGTVTGDDGTATITLKNGIYRIVGIDTDAIYSVTAQKITVKK